MLLTTVSQDEQHEFLAAYLEELNGHAPASADVVALQREVAPFALSSHLMWGLWSLAMAQGTTADFDYTQYARLRFEEYQKRKDEVLAAPVK
jgi:ethanolamine kinase